MLEFDVSAQEVEDADRLACREGRGGGGGDLELLLGRKAEASDSPMNDGLRVDGKTITETISTISETSVA